MPNSPIHVSERSAAHSLRRHYEMRREALRCLLVEAPLLVRQSGRPEGEKPALLLAVDWSEVYAYITSTSLPTSEPLLRIFTEPPCLRLVDGAHQAALSFLFERLKGPPLIVLPPYLEEMGAFVNIVRRELFQSAADAEARTLLPEIGEADDTEAPERDVVTEVLEAYVAAAKRKEGRPPTLDDMRAVFKDLERESAFDDLIRQAFGPLYLFGRFWTEDVASMLRRLTAGQPKILRALGESDTEIAVRAGAGAAMLSHWSERLARIAWGQAELSRERDAEALAYLEVLDKLLHDRGQQILFATRSVAMASAAEEEPGRLACLGDGYWDAEGGPPTLVRSWLYFLELGALWDLPESERQRQLIQRLVDVKARLEWLEASGREGEGIFDVHRDAIEQDLRDVQNYKSLLAATDGFLARRRAKQEADKHAMELLVRYLTRSDLFTDGREQLFERVSLEVREVLTHIALPAPERPIQLDTESGTRDVYFKPLLRTVFQRIDIVDLEAASGRRLSPETRSVLAALAPSADDGGPEGPDFELLGALHKRIGDVIGPKARRTPEHFLLSAAWSYAGGHFAMAANSAKLVLQRDLTDPARLSALRFLAHLIIADQRLFVRRSPSFAHQALTTLMSEIGLHRERLSLFLAVLNARFVLALHAAEFAEERIACLPRTASLGVGLPDRMRPPAPDKSDVANVMAEVMDVLSMKLAEGLASNEPDAWPVNACLRVALVNNLVYAGTRLEPLEEERDHHQEEPPASKPSDGRFLREAGFLAWVEFLERASVSRPDANRLDTLGYYYLKRAALGSSSPAKDFDAARAYLASALEAASTPRVRAVVEGHLRLLHRVGPLPA